MKDIIVDDRYRVEKKIGEGGFGMVYSGTDLQTEEKVALKLTHVRDDRRPLEGEKETYDALAGGLGIPKVHWFGQECDYYVLACDLLGPSLEDLLNYCDRTLSLKTIILIADQAISRIEYIHSKGYLHRDIKPENFLMGVGRQGNILYTIDFGLAKEHQLAEGDRKYKGRPLGGTARYASINNHNGCEQSWGDDLESLGYVLLYFVRGSLPWQGLKAATGEEKNKMIKEKKESLSGEQLCEGHLPDEFAEYINYTRSLNFDDKPDYAYLRGLLHRLFISRGFSYDNVFDWTEKRFYELRAAAGLPREPTAAELEAEESSSPSETTPEKGTARGGRHGRAQRRSCRQS
ncbi:hypothetical protein QQS21_009897 [Conoideocrella luteorostrata]|uniref:non-specific serine/threonine protein kinase n=1 Tax=Conoideocrella luteorostrata TaxID=1105319 RepID=A0AAJ0CIT2_9HYPO|nr:hypothetical protein QQS21_009897 [Conoideocrella luteorostrata]